MTKYYTEISASGGNQMLLRPLQGGVKSRSAFNAPSALMLLPREADSDTISMRRSLSTTIDSIPPPPAATPFVFWMLPVRLHVTKADMPSRRERTKSTKHHRRNTATLKNQPQSDIENGILGFLEVQKQHEKLGVMFNRLFYKLPSHKNLVNATPPLCTENLTTLTPRLLVDDHEQDR